MNQEMALMLLTFVALLCLRVPIAYVLGMTTLLTAYALGYSNITTTIASIHITSTTTTSNSNKTIFL